MSLPPNGPDGARVSGNDPAELFTQLFVQFLQNQNNVLSLPSSVPHPSHQRTVSFQPNPSTIPAFSSVVSERSRGMSQPSPDNNQDVGTYLVASLPNRDASRMQHRTASLSCTHTSIGRAPTDPVSYHPNVTEDSLQLVRAGFG